MESPVMDLARVEAKIRESVDQVRRAGVRIVSNRYGVRYTGGWRPVDGEDEGACCCPLGAVLLCTDRTKSLFHGQAVMDTLGVTHGWLEGFLAAFDGAPAEERADAHGDAYTGFDMGMRMRVEFINRQEVSQ